MLLKNVTYSSDASDGSGAKLVPIAPLRIASGTPPALRVFESPPTEPSIQPTVGRYCRPAAAPRTAADVVVVAKIIAISTASGLSFPVIQP